MKILSIVKHTIGLTASFGTGIVIASAFKAVLPPDQKLISKIATTTAGVVISSMLGDATAKYVEKTFDDLQDGIEAAKVDTVADISSLPKE